MEPRAFLVFALVAGLGSNAYETRERSQRVLLNVHHALEKKDGVGLRLELPQWHEDPEIKSRLRRVWDKIEEADPPFADP